MRGVRIPLVKSVTLIPKRWDTFWAAKDKRKQKDSYYSVFLTESKRKRKTFWQLSLEKSGNSLQKTLNERQVAETKYLPYKKNLKKTLLLQPILQFIEFLQKSLEYIWSNSLILLSCNTGALERSSSVINLKIHHIMDFLIKLILLSSSTD